ncbi:MAG: hypothetical protein IJG61_08945 [Lachnospiraceae bacterium]|nr:hypothetical protein [Lachnospiraceae bacterium]
MKKQNDQDILRALREENAQLREAVDTAPCGLLCFTCGASPRVTSVNRTLTELLRIDAEDEEKLSFYKNNVYLMIAQESREAFASALDSVRQTGRPAVGEVAVVCADGAKIRLFGRVELRGDGFVCSCFDVTEHHRAQREEKSDRYLQALTGVYDLIFEFDRGGRTMKCLKSRLPGAEGLSSEVAMQADAAVSSWVRSAVAEENRGRVRGFLDRYVLKGDSRRRGLPPRTRFKIRTAEGADIYCQGILLAADDTATYFCARHVGPKDVTAALQSENSSLKGMNENMQELVKRVTEDVVAFELTGDLVRPLYASENVCAFFGYSPEAWSRLMKKRLTIREFVAGTGVPYDEYEKLFATGEAGFSYTDVQSGERKSIRAMCSGKNGDPQRYVVLYSLDSSAAGSGAAANGAEKPRVFVRMFGYFDVFVDGKPILFKNEKAKELFALLADRRGGYVSADEAIATLWEDEPASSVVLSRYRKVALRLKNLLEEFGISDVVEYVNGKRRLVTEKVTCDLYQYLAGEEGAENLFNGSYLSNYSWGEVTLGELDRLAGE